VAFLEEFDDKTYTHVELADLFKVDEAVIRRDRKKSLVVFSQQISPAHALAFVAEAVKEINVLIRKCKKGLDEATPLTLSHLKYIELMSALQMRRLKILQEVGVVPKELGHLSMSEEEWIAEVNPDGVTSVHPANADTAGLVGMLPMTPDAPLPVDDDDDDDA